MYGFQPKHARGKPAQALADGGLVHSITGMLGMRKKTPEEMLAADAKVQERNREAAARVAARAKPAQPAAPAEEKAVFNYAGMSALQRREKELGLKDGGSVGGFKPGGLIRGPGTGTSDSIKTEKRPGTFIMPADSTQAIGPEVLEELAEPMEAGEEGEGMETEGAENEGPEEEGEGETVPVRLSNGEFEYTPQQVQSLGEAVLTVLRDATHTPVEGGKPTAKGFAPNQFFANGGTVFGSRGLAGLREMIPKMEAMGYPQALDDGGTVKDEEQQRLANQTAMYVRGAQEAAANRPPAPPDAAASQVQNKAPARTAAPFATTAPTSAGFMPGTRAVFNESGKAIGDLANQGRYAAAAGETARAALAYVPAVVDDVVGGAVRAVGPALADAGKQFLGMNEAPAPAPAPVPAAASENPGPAAPTGTTQASSAPTGQVAIQPMDDGAQPVAPTQSTAAAPQPQAEQVAPGAYRYGRGQYGDSPTGQQGVVPGPAGQPNAQNMAAADALVARQTPAGFQPAGSQPAGVQAPVVRNSTNDWAARNALRNLEVSASSITNQPGFSRGGRGYVPPAVAAYQAGLQTDAALQQAQPGMDQTAMRENAGIQREGMQQEGATTRTRMTEQGANAREAGRNALAQGEFGLKREAAGFQTRAAAQQEQLLNKLIDPKATPEQRKQAQEYLQALAISGKEPSPQYKSYVMPAIRNADGSTTEGGVYQENTRTGEGRWVKPPGDGQAQQAMPKPASKAEFDALPKGTRFTDPNGQVRIK